MEVLCKLVWSEEYIYEISTYPRESLSQLVLVIRSFCALLSREANLQVHRRQVRLASLAEGIEKPHLHDIGQRDLSPCSLRIGHADLAGREALEGPRCKHVESVYEESDVGPIAGWRYILGRNGNP